METESESMLESRKNTGIVNIDLTGLVASVIINQTKNSLPGCFAHISTSLANDLLESLHHGVLHADVAGLGSSNEFWRLS